MKSIFFRLIAPVCFTLWLLPANVYSPAGEWRSGSVCYAKNVKNRDLVLDVSQRPSSAPQRVALVIGNGAYQKMPLKNPVKDAEDMTILMRSLGFDVVQRINADRKQMVEGIEEFYEKLSWAEVGLFYFAGHGLQVNGRNYLIPVKNRIQTESDVEFESVAVGRVIGKMKTANVRVNIIILDACRNNPFTRGFNDANQGLAIMDAPQGTFIAYSTAPDSVAEDGEADNSAFARNLLTYAQTPGLSIEQVFKRVRREVLRETEDRQVPWQSSSLTREFYFVIDEPADTSPDTTPESSDRAPSDAKEIPDLDEVIKKRETLADQWSAWQKRMAFEFAKAEKYDQSDMLEHQEKAQAWHSFLSAFPQDNPFDTEDELMRREARRRYEQRRKLIEPAPVKTGKIYVNPRPADAVVKIMNIGPRYHRGMTLQPGKYRIEVSRTGYHTVSKWVILAQGRDLHLDIALTRTATKTPDPKQPAPSPIDEAKKVFKRFKRDLKRDLPWQ